MRLRDGKLSMLIITEYLLPKGMGALFFIDR